MSSKTSTLGSTIKIPIALLFKEWTEIIEKFEYMVRPLHYGVVTRYSKEQGYNVEWKFRVMFDLGHIIDDEIGKK